MSLNPDFQVDWINIWQPHILLMTLFQSKTTWGDGATLFTEHRVVAKIRHRQHLRCTNACCHYTQRKNSKTWKGIMAS